ncbi:hypothetical protein D3C86_1322140 [compost metagenome]
MLGVADPGEAVTTDLHRDAADLPGEPRLVRGLAQSAVDPSDGQQGTIEATQLPLQLRMLPKVDHQPGRDEGDRHPHDEHHREGDQMPGVRGREGVARREPEKGEGQDGDGEHQQRGAPVAAQRQQEQSEQLDHDEVGARGVARDQLPDGDAGGRDGDRPREGPLRPGAKVRPDPRDPRGLTLSFTRHPHSSPGSCRLLFDSVITKRRQLNLYHDSDGAYHPRA